MSTTSTSELTLTDLGAPQEVADRLQRVADKLQMIPAVAMRALEIADAPDCPTGAFAAVIERDVSLTSDVLKMANSALYSRGSAIASLHQAITRLGFRRCKNLILASSVTSLMRKLTLDEEWVREILWRHSFLTAIIATHLNSALRIGFSGEEFTAGLIHDLGRTMLAVGLPERFSEIDSLHFDESADVLTHECAIVGTNHCDVGAWFATCNRLPPSLIETIRNHHTPEQAGEHMQLTALTAAADHAANHQQRCGKPENYEPGTNTAVALLETTGVRNAKDRFAEIAQTVMTEAAQATEGMMIL